MQRQDAIRVSDLDALDDAELVQLARGHDSGAFRVVMDGATGVLRIARARHPVDSEAEDAVQEAYFHAFVGDSSLATWLTRMAWACSQAARWEVGAAVERKSYRLAIERTSGARNGSDR